MRLYERVGFTRCVDFPNNYALRIMNYELFSASLHTLHSLDRLDLLDHIVYLLKIVDEQ